MIVQQEEADLVIVNATILTMNPAKPVAQALAVQNGRFIAVGRSTEVSRRVGPKTEVWDMGGKAIVPGFNDAHLHPGAVYPEDKPYARLNVGPANAPDIESLLALLRRKAERTPKGLWVRGSGYQETKLGRHPTRYDLDKASTEHPIIISHSSGHISVCNSYALRMAKVTRDTKDPSGGVFGRDANGEPNGFLGESAAAIVRNAGPKMPEPSDEETLEGYRVCFDRYVAKGITSIGIAGTSLSTVSTLGKLRERGWLPVRVYAMLREADIAMLEQRRRDNKLGDDWLRLGAVKIFHGNSLSGQTCWLYEPYANRPDYFGVKPARSQTDLNVLILKIHRAGLQACVHSNGDREIDMVLEAIERAQRTVPRPNARHRIEHGSIVNQKILERIKRLGVVLVPHSYTYEHGDKYEAYGEKRWNWMHPNGSAVRMGLHCAAHSDSPVSAADPMLRIQSMVTRKSEQGKVYGPAQRVSVEQALRLWTAGGAFATFEESQKGTIEPGKWADFAVLERDPRAVPPDALKEVAVERTVVAGKTVFERKPGSEEPAQYASVLPEWDHTDA
ncbi:MAG: amidohydrolase [Armatimonadaceae bacterium]